MYNEDIMNRLEDKDDEHECIDEFQKGLHRQRFYFTMATSSMQLKDEATFISYVF